MRISRISRSYHVQFRNNNFGLELFQTLLLHCAIILVKHPIKTKILLSFLIIYLKGRANERNRERERNLPFVRSLHKCHLSQIQTGPNPGTQNSIQISWVAETHAPESSLPPPRLHNTQKLEWQ